MHGTGVFDAACWHSRRRLGLERHAALGTTARTCLLDFGVHRAGISDGRLDRTCKLGGYRLFGWIVLRRLSKFTQAVFGAEEMGSVLMDEAVRAVLCHLHAAYRVSGHIDLPFKDNAGRRAPSRRQRRQEEEILQAYCLPIHPYPCCERANAWRWASVSTPSIFCCNSMVDSCCWRCNSKSFCVVPRMASQSRLSAA